MTDDTTALLYLSCLFTRLSACPDLLNSVGYEYVEPSCIIVNITKDNLGIGPVVFTDTIQF